MGRATPLERHKDPAVRRRIGRAAATWLGLTLGAIATLGALIVWHLIRRGRLIREAQPAPKAIRTLERDEPAPP